VHADHAGAELCGFTSAKIDWNGIIATYIGIPLFLLLWLGYKWKHGSKLIALDKIALAEAHAQLERSSRPVVWRSRLQTDTRCA
jgi:lysine-specific permease